MARLAPLTARVVPHRGTAVALAETRWATRGDVQEVETRPARRGSWGPETRERKGRAVGIGGILGRLAPAGLAMWQRTMTPEEAWRVYLKTPDVRAAIDSIVRRVATWDWRVVPEMDARDEAFEAATEQCAEAQRWLAVPNLDGDTWNEVWTKVLTDLLVHDAGALELASTGKVLDELNPLAGPTVFPAIAENGRIYEYVQDPLGYGTNERIGAAGVTSQVPKAGAAPGTNPLTDGQSITVHFRPDEIVYLRLFPNTASPLGNPLLESLVAEVTALLLAAERAGIAFDADEVPPGMVVVTGIANESAEAMRLDLQRLKGKDRKIRLMASPTPGMVDVKWVEFRRNDKDVQFAEIMKEMRRTIWRVFGVQRVEMGDTEDMPRAVGEVQMDVSSSHLIQPILELIEAKINARILPFLVKPKWLGKVKFEFIKEAKETAKDEGERTKADVELLKVGAVTVNEIRVKRGYKPYGPEGDVPMVFTSAGPVPLVAVAFPPKAKPVQEDPGGGGDENPDTGDGSGNPGSSPPEDGNDGGKKEGGGTEPSDAEHEVVDDAPGEGETTKARAQKKTDGHVHGVDCGCVRSLTPTGIPSDWQAEGKFKGYRTLDLEHLGGLIVGYEKAVAPLYDEAAATVARAAMDGHTVGSTSPDDPEGTMRTARRAMDALVAGWTRETASFYVDTAIMAARQAAEWTRAERLTSDEEEDARKAGVEFGASAMRYLAVAGGLTEALLSRVEQIVVRVTGPGSRTATDERAELGAMDLYRELTPDSTPEEVADATLAAFKAEAHRVQNWSGKLVELANKTMSDTLDKATRKEMIDPNRPTDQMADEWWGEWVAVGDDEMCIDCRYEGGLGFRPLVKFTRVPGGCRCRGRCRCVVTCWLKSEIDSGQAVSLSYYDI